MDNKPWRFKRRHRIAQITGNMYLLGITVIFFFFSTNNYETLPGFFVDVLLSCLASPMDYWLCTTFHSPLWNTLCALNRVQQFCLIFPTALKNGVLPVSLLYRFGVIVCTKSYLYILKSPICPTIKALTLF